MIGIIGAMDVEIEGLVSLIENPVYETVSNINFISGDAFGKKIVVAKCGIGKVFAAICAQTMILKYKPDCIINSGVAGGVCRDLDIGDIAVASDVVQHDLDTTALGDPKGLISGINIVNVPCNTELSEKLFEAAKNCGFNSKIGTLATGDQFVAKGSESLDELRKLFNPLTTDMEGASIGQTCFVNAVPFTVIRALSDKADDNADCDYVENLKKSSENSFKTLEQFLKSF